MMRQVEEEVLASRAKPLILLIYFCNKQWSVWIAVAVKTAVQNV